MIKTTVKQELMGYIFLFGSFNRWTKDEARKEAESHIRSKFGNSKRTKESFNRWIEIVLTDYENMMTREKAKVRRWK